jgi:hypothetical protein
MANLAQAGGAKLRVPVHVAGRRIGWPGCRRWPGFFCDGPGHEAECGSFGGLGKGPGVVANREEKGAEMLRLVGEIVAAFGVAVVCYGGFEFWLARNTWNRERAAFRAIHGDLYWD